LACFENERDKQKTLLYGGGFFEKYLREETF
jgi:hypothetical protein